MALQALVAGDPSLIWLSIEHVMEEGKKAISHIVIETTRCQSPKYENGF